MSSALKRKTRPKRPARQPISDRDWKLTESCFSEIFTSMQLICFTVLYSDPEDGGFDFGKQKLKNFNDFLRKHNREIVDKLLDSRTTESKFRKAGFDCEREASNFPYRAKLKMYGKKLKTKREYDIMLASVNVAIESYLILAVYTLRTHYNFTWEMINVWWNSCLQTAGLYSVGLTDDFIVDFIKDEIDLEVTK